MARLFTANYYYGFAFYGKVFVCCEHSRGGVTHRASVLPR